MNSRPYWDNIFKPLRVIPTIPRTFFIVRNLLLFLLFASTLFSSYQKGLDEFRLHRYRDAHDSFLAALKNKEMPGESAYFLGKIFLLGQELKKAYKYYLLAFKYNSQNEDLPQDFQECIEELRNALPFNEFHSLYTQTYQKGVFPIPIIYYRIKNLQNRLEFPEILTTYEDVKDHPSFQIGKRFYSQSLAFVQYYAAVSYLKVSKDTLKALAAIDLSVKSDPDLSIARKLLNSLKKKQEALLVKQLKQGEQFFLNRDFEKSGEFFTRALETDPQNPDARKGVEKSRLAQQSFTSLEEAKGFIAQARYEMALKKLKFAATAYPDNFEAKNLRQEIENKILEKLNLERQKDEAEKNKEREYYSHLSEGNNYLNTNQFQKAVDSFQRSLEIKPESKKAKSGLKISKQKLAVYDSYQKGLELLDKEDFSTALKILEEVQKKGVEFDRLYSAILNGNFRARNYMKVIEMAIERKKVYPNDTDNLYLLARSYEETMAEEESHLNDAIRAYSQLLKINPSYIDAKDRRSKLRKIKYAPMAAILGVLLLVMIVFIWLYRTKDLRKRRKFLNQVERASQGKNFPKLVQHYERMNFINLTMDETLKTLPTFMNALVEVGRFDDALKIGPKILSAMPQHQQVLLLMARAYYELKIFNPGLLKYYEPLFASEQMSDTMVEWIGNRIVSQDMDNEKTLPVLWRYFDLHPENEKCRKILLKYLKEEDSMSRRLVDMMEAEIKFNPRDIPCRLKLAEYYLEKRQLETSIRYCEEVINLNPTERKLHEILYAAYEKQENLEALKPVYESLLQLYPNSIILQETQNKIRLATGQTAISQTELSSYQSSDSKKEV